ncbi:MAG: hypothetical protein JNL10_03155 [Verrucomicrobiales bacterium]|nr:hypothetical protein [Verrucomicrobiales bacterium]
MSKPHISEFIPEPVNIAANAKFRGVPVESVQAEVLERVTGGFIAGDPGKLEARRAKAEAELAKIAAEEAHAQGIAARYHQLSTDLARLLERERQGGFTVEWLVTSAAARWEQAGLQIGTPNAQPWETEALLDSALRATASVAAAKELLAPIRAQIEAKRAEVDAFAQEHAINAGKP